MSCACVMAEIWYVFTIPAPGALQVRESTQITSWEELQGLLT